MTGEKVLIVNKEESEIIRILWELNEYDVYTSKSIEEAKGKAKTLDPDVILIDNSFTMEEFTDFISSFRKIFGQDLPFIVIGDTEKEEEKYLKLNVNDFMYKPYNISIVKLRIRNQIRIRSLIANAESVSITDELTKLPNRRAYNKILMQLWESGIKNNNSIALIMGDIDHFKNFNDTYGHDIGDDVLKFVAKKIRNSLKRKTDFAFRWGGEEFIVLLYGADDSIAKSIAENIRKNIEESEFTVRTTGQLEHITMSLGVNSVHPSDAVDPISFLEKADTALYKAKNSGRNQVVCYGE